MRVTAAFKTKNRGKRREFGKDGLRRQNMIAEAEGANFVAIILVPARATYAQVC